MASNVDISMYDFVDALARINLNPSCIYQHFIHDTFKGERNTRESLL